MDCLAVVDHIASWIKKEILKRNRDCAVVGVSGGIDSALVSTLCCIAGVKTDLFIMSIHQSPDHVTRAKNHIDWLMEKKSFKIILHELDLTHKFDVFCEGFPNNDLARANLRSRMRMNTLYYYATHIKGLVIGTGNKVEDFGLGFFTKYGDGGVDISPIGKLTKTQVRELSSYLDINEEILKASPSDGLWDDNRTDESQLGDSYEEFEWAMKLCEKYDITEIDEQCPIYTGLTERKRSTLSKYTMLHNLSLHKMEPIPICDIPEDIL